jgi:hypothetical protein
MHLHHIITAKQTGMIAEDMAVPAPAEEFPA